MNAHVGRTSAISFGARSLLAFALEPTPPLFDWFAALDAWLTRSPNFFSGRPVILQLGALDIQLKDYRDLLADLALRHIRVMAVENPARTLVGPHLPPIVVGGRVVGPEKLFENEEAPRVATTTAPAPAHAPKPNSLFVDGNLRSGQSVVHLEGDVTIFGRVGSGAEVVAGGSVHVYGALQGRVFAGVSGATEARVICREARAELICIAGAHVTAEHMDPRIDGRSAEARLVGDQIQIRALN